MAKKNELKKKVKKLKKKVEQLRAEKKQAKAQYEKLINSSKEKKAKNTVDESKPAVKKMPRKKGRPAGKLLKKTNQVKQVVPVMPISKTVKKTVSEKKESNGKPSASSKSRAAKTGKASAGRKKAVKKPATGATPFNLGKIGTARAAERDDLTRIQGIGPSAQKKLNAIGIYTYRQISNMTPADIASVSEAAGPFRGTDQPEQLGKTGKEFAKIS